MPYRATAFVLCCLSVLLACDAFAAVRDPGVPADTEIVPERVEPDPARSFVGLVLGVEDGDSITVSVEGTFHRVEILGADAPEWVERAETQRAYAPEARRFLINMLLGERVLLFEPRPDATDPLGRRRAYVFREPDQLFVDLEIVRQGYGRVSTRAGEPYADLLRHYEQRARTFRRGIWDPDYDPGESQTPETTRTADAPAAPEPAAAPDPEPESTPQPEPVTDRDWVWITRSGSKYHREDCSHLTTTRTRVRRDSVRTTHDACKSCTPDD